MKIINELIPHSWNLYAIFVQINFINNTFYEERFIKGLSYQLFYLHVVQNCLVCFECNVYSPTEGSPIGLLLKQCGYNIYNYTMQNCVYREI